MSMHEPNDPLSRQALSSLVDGEATESEAANLFQRWRDDAELQQTWHLYQLIGDTMRSDEFAMHPRRSQRLVSAVRSRLAEEPVVLAPDVAEQLAPDVANAQARVSPVASPNNRVSGGRLTGLKRWQAPVATAAGFLAVLGGLNFAGVAFQSSPATAGPTMAHAVHPGDVEADASPPSGIPAANSAQARAAAAAELAPYVAAHQQSTMNDVFHMPGDGFRTVSLVQSAP